MNSYKFLVLLLIAFLCGCASAEKRLEQGTDLEARGQYENAVMRYVQALEKDPSLDEARIRLVEAGDQAIADRLQDSRELITRGDPLGSAAHLHRLDTVVAKARSVGVRLTVPVDYSARRREVFDDAFESLVARGTMARQQGRWEAGLEDYRRARREFEPSLEQRNRALTEESTLLVQWSEGEYERGHLRNAFGIAANVMEMEWSPPAQAARASALMEDSLLEGEIELIVLPVRAPSGRRRDVQLGDEIAGHVEAELRQGPWHNPPAFVQVQESLAVQALMERAGILDNEYREATLALILQLAKADYAAHLQLLTTEATEFDVRSSTQSGKTRAGDSATFIREDGQRRLQATVRIVIADGFGNAVTDVVVAGSGTAPFVRGVYDGDPRELNLGSRQVDLFDQFALQEQEQAVRRALVGDLSANIANAVFEATLARIP